MEKYKFGSRVKFSESVKLNENWRHISIDDFNALDSDDYIDINPLHGISTRKVPLVGIIIGEETLFNELHVENVERCEPDIEFGIDREYETLDFEKRCPFDVYRIAVEGRKKIYNVPKESVEFVDPAVVNLQIHLTDDLLNGTITV